MSWQRDRPTPTESVPRHDVVEVDPGGASGRIRQHPLLKTVPGVGTVAGGLLQGLTQALVTRWIGKVFIAYFGSGMTADASGLTQLARDKWSEVTQPDQLLKLIQAGRKEVRSGER